MYYHLLYTKLLVNYNNVTFYSLFYSGSNERYRHLHDCLVVLSFFGFLFFDLLYIAVVINYVTQCQLLHFFIRNLKEKVRTKAFLLGYAVKV